MDRIWFRKARQLGSSSAAANGFRPAFSRMVYDYTHTNFSICLGGDVIVINSASIHGVRLSLRALRKCAKASDRMTRAKSFAQPAVR